MEGLHEAQLALHSKISNSFENFRKKGAQKMTRGGAQARLEELETLYNQASSIHEKILKLSPLPINHDYFALKLFDLITDTYYDRKGDYKEFLIELGEQKATAGAGNANQVFGDQAANPELSNFTQALPKIDVPTFSGKYSEWENFRDVYRAMIHRREDLAAVVKFYYLRTHLQDEALALVKNLALTDENYPKAWEKLTERYENERRVINLYVAEIYAVKPVKAESSSELKRILQEIFDPIDSLQALGRPADQWDDLIVFWTASRFDSNTRKDWEKFQGDSAVAPSIVRIKEFLRSQIITLESIESGHKSSVTNKQSSASHTTKNSTQSNSSVNLTQTPSNKSSSKENKTPTCSLCDQPHFLSSCDNFKNKTVADRKSFVQSKQLCYNCLGSHFLKNCQSQHRCKVNQCKGKHHTLLHTEKKPPASSDQREYSTQPPTTGKYYNKNVVFENQSKSCAVTPTPNCHSIPKKGILLATARVIIVAPNGLKISARALLDNCSQTSIISEFTSQQLRLKSRTVNTPVTCVGGEQAFTGKKLTHFRIQPHFESSFSCEVEALIAPKVASYSPPTVRESGYFKYLENIELADPNFMDHSQIDLLLDADIYGQILLGDIIKGKANEPVAVKSTLGWILMGSVPSCDGSVTSNLVTLHCSVENDLSNAVQNFWRQEEVPKRKFYTPEEEECEEHYKKTHSRDSTGRYVVRLPFKNSAQPSRAELGSSFNPACRMLYKMESEFKKDSRFKELYNKFMNEYEALGHMDRILSTDNDTLGSTRYYLPHHGILRESSSTTKLRTVFNASCKTSSRSSLNDMLHTGPNLLPELPDLICAWRRYKVVFITDIVKMYRQINVAVDDRPFQAILWRDSDKKPIDVYHLSTVTYGMNCSPFLATRTLRQLAQDHGDQYPFGASVLQKETYMDDMLSGADTIEQALVKQKNLIDLLMVGGFPLSKWQANDPKLLDWLPSDLLATDLNSNFESSTPSSAVLGICWRNNEDCFSFKINCLPPEGKITKRVVLSQIAKIFDPMGWLAPIVVSAKIFMQRLWLLGGGWDDELPQNLIDQWLNYCDNLACLNDIRIPRFIHWYPNLDICEIHGFADASQRAYGAVVYLRCVESSEVHVTQQLAKTKVAPLKTLSIPRLELNAAHLLSNLVNHYRSVIPFKIDSVHLWSDSKDVLYWLRDHPVRWQTFVANRCSDISSLVPDAHWHHVRSGDNPADMASRGIPPEELKNCQLWWNGPSWLKDSCEPWPTTPDDLSTHKPVEVRSSFENSSAFPSAHLTQKKMPEVWDLSWRYSNFDKLLGVTAFVLRFIAKLEQRVIQRRQLKNKPVPGVNTRSKSKRNFDLPSNQRPSLETSKLQIFKLKFLNLQTILRPDEVGIRSAEELENARLLWVYWHQRAQFSEEIRHILKFNEVQVKSPLKTLKPFLDNDLLRVGGRLHNALLDHDVKHPLILSNESYFATLLIRHTHLKKTLHGGTQLTLGTLRRQYWITRGRIAVKAVIHKCVKCLRYRAATANQVMGNFPLERVKPSFPFQASGVDYAGPITLRITKHRGKGTFKGYVALFICFSTRAVHLEAVEDCTTEAFIAAFQRFTSRRGHCKELFSDNGPNFTGADAELQAMFDEAADQWKEVAHLLAQDGTDWHFNPPAAPHTGGYWEAAVKSVKHHLRRVVGDHLLTFIELTTLLCKIEACLNSRPLYAMTDDPTDLNVLSPAHFLILRSSFLVPEPDCTKENIPAGRRWQLISQMAQKFWNRWSAEYITSLQERPKWQRTTTPLKVNDLVLIRNELTPPGKWPLARVVEAHPPKTGETREYIVRTADSKYRRHIQKLVVLQRMDETSSPIPPQSDQ